MEDETRNILQDLGLPYDITELIEKKIEEEEFKQIDDAIISTFKLERDPKDFPYNLDNKYFVKYFSIERYFNRPDYTEHLHEVDISENMREKLVDNPILAENYVDLKIKLQICKLRKLWKDSGMDSMFVRGGGQR